jgi:hypothetical protein
MNRIERSFSKLLGMPCWGVSRGFGSFLTLEFGAPRLIVREPVVTSTEASPRVKRVLAKRSVHVRGDWHLWIHSCEWRVQAQGKLIGDWTTPRRIQRAARELNGQSLQEVTVGRRGAATRFAFDLGAELETKPYDRSGEQWLLYEPDGTVLTWRADRKYQPRGQYPGARTGGMAEIDGVTSRCT